MAKISDAFILCRNNASEDYIIGISYHASPNRIIVTYNKKGVYIYDFEEKNAYKSWSIEQRFHATHYAIQVEKTNNYYCVFNQKDIFHWNDDCQTFADFSRTSVDNPVYRLHSPTPTPTLVLNQPIVISTDGTVALISGNSDDIIATPRKKARKTRLNRSDAVVWSAVWSHEKNGLHVGLITYRDSEYCLNVKNFRDENQSFIDVLVVNLSIPNQTNLLATDYDHSHNILVTQWSDRSLRQSQNIVDLMENKDSLYSESSCINLPVVQQKSLTGSKKKDFKVVLTVLDSNYAASIEKCYNNDIMEAVLSVWDLTFGTLQYRQNILASSHLNLEDEDNFCSDHTLQALRISPYIFIAIDNVVVACSYECQPASLLSALGMKNPSTGSVGTDAINILDWKGHEKDHNLLKAWNDVTTNLLNERNYTSVKRFDKAVDEILSIMNPVKTYAKTIYCSAISQLLHQCIVTEKIWPRSSIMKLIRTKAISLSACPLLFPTIFEKDDMELFLLSVKKIRILSEAIIVKGLKYILLANESSFTKADKELKKNNNTELDNALIEFNEIRITKRKAEYLNLLLKQIDCHLHFIIGELKNLTAQECLALLRYLIDALKHRMDEKNGTEIIKQTLVIDWINALLDSHYIQLTLSAEAHQVIKELHQFVQIQVHLYDKIYRLRGYLEYFKGSFGLSKPKQIQNYSIEVISL